MKTKLFPIVFFIAIQFSYSSNNWNITYIGQPSSLRGVFFLNSQTGFIVGDGIILKTTNSGNNWTSTQTRFNLKEVYFLNDLTGYLAGKTNDSGYVLKTTNGGNSWISYFLGIQPSSFDLRKIFFKNADTGYIVRETNGYYRTTNGGSLWVFRAFPTYERIRDVILKGNTYYKIGSVEIGGYYKPAYWSSTDEENWGNEIDCIECDNNEYGLTIYLGDTVKYLITEGTNWRFRRSSSQNPAWMTIAYSANGYSHFFVNAANIHWGYTSGNKSLILSSSNSGYNWVQDTLVDFAVRDIYFVNSSLGFAVSSNGLIAKTENGGGTIGLISISNNVPKNYYLSQNYPNPFNPITNIQFDINKAGNVMLSIYDELGCEINILVNEYLQPGTYKVDWNAYRNSSGIYFYKLTTKDFTTTKKMVLSK